MRAFLSRLVTFFRARRADAEISRELAAHLQLLEDDYMARGMSRDDARFAARRAFGGQVEQTKLRHRDARSFRVLDQSWLDIKLAGRMLVRYPGLTVVAVVGMAAGMAIAVGGFAIFGMLLNPSVPLHEGDRIVTLQNWDVSRNNADTHTLHDFATWRHDLDTLQDVGAWRAVGRNLIQGGVLPEVVPVAEVTASAFRLARVTPQMGRYLVEDDERYGAPPVIVIGHDMWRSALASDPDVIGRTLQLGPTVYTIVGVMPQGFAFPVNHELWVPFTLDPSQYAPGTGPSINVFGRLAPGATLESANAELATVGRRARETSPATHEHLRPRAIPYTYFFTDMDEPENAISIRIMQFLMSILLAIVSVNVAILVYARTATRHAEIAVRSALGAGRRRIVFQLFVEALALSGVAATLALTIVALGLRELRAALLTIEDQLPFWFQFGLSPGAVVYALLLAIFAAAVISAVPALKMTGRHVQHGLKDVSMGGGAGMRLGRTWTSLIVAQVAVAVTLLPTAVYHAWDATRYGTADYGFPAENILNAQIDMDVTVSAAAPDGTRDPHFHTRFADRQLEIVRRVAGEPTVAGVAFALHRIGQQPRAWIDVEGVASPARSDDYRVGAGSSRGHAVHLNRVAAEWFDVHDMPLVAGRMFSGADANPSSITVLVNTDFAREVLGNRSAIGGRFRYVGLSGDANLDSVELERWHEIVGVIDDLPPSAAPGAVNARIYHPLAAGQFHPMLLTMRIRGEDAMTFAGRLRHISAGVDPNVQLRDIERAADFLRRDVGMFRLIAIGLVALTLAVVMLSAAGIYALMSCTVEQRRKEIGIRAALGADARRILAAIFARALGQVAVGAGIGVSVASLLELASGGELLAGHAPVVLPIVALVMMAVGLLAAWGPARRGLRIHPMDTLRAE